MGTLPPLLTGEWRCSEYRSLSRRGSRRSAQQFACWRCWLPAELAVAVPGLRRSGEALGLR